MLLMTDDQKTEMQNRIQNNVTYALQEELGKFINQWKRRTEELVKQIDETNTRYNEAIVKNDQILKERSNFYKKQIQEINETTAPIEMVRGVETEIDYLRQDQVEKTLEIQELKKIIQDLESKVKTLETVYEALKQKTQHQEQFDNTQDVSQGNMQNSGESKDDSDDDVPEKGCVLSESSETTQIPQETKNEDMEKMIFQLSDEGLTQRSISKVVKVPLTRVNRILTARKRELAQKQTEQPESEQNEEKKPFEYHYEGAEDSPKEDRKE